MGAEMKKFLFLTFFLLSLNTFAAYVYWNQDSETNTLWNFNLDVYRSNSYKDYGVYSLEDGIGSRTSLKDGDNIFTVTENLGFWVRSNNNRIYTSYSNANQKFTVSDGYVVDVLSGNYSTAARITISPVVSPNGQPLPGVLAAMFVGAGVLGGSRLFRRNQRLA